MKRRILYVSAFAMLAVATTGCMTGGGSGYNMPPMERLMAPGPGVAGPGPGVLTASDMMNGPNCATGGGFGGMEIASAPAPAVQCMFVKPQGMQVIWDTAGTGDFTSPPLVAPGRINLTQAGLYRMKLQGIPGHEGMELYPTIEVGPSNPRTLAYLAHNAIPLQLTTDDFNQVMAGNFVTKVIYLPDPEFQELAVAGVETLVSTRLDPGVDPVVEADRRGSILGILRIGNKDIEMPGMENEANAFAGTLGGAAGSGGPGMPGPVYGMPITGTPLGLPGPVHLPLGGPAGMQKHVIYNHTPTYIPDPSKKVKIHLNQQPGVSYPEPRTRAFINQYNPPTCNHCGSVGGNGCKRCTLRR